MAGVFLAFVVVSRTTAELKLAGIALKRLKMFTLNGDVVSYDQRVREGAQEHHVTVESKPFQSPGSILSLATQWLHFEMREEVFTEIYRIRLENSLEIVER